MSHNYLFDSYAFIQERRNTAMSIINDPESDEGSVQEARGSLFFLDNLEGFLKNQYEHKLPRRLRRKIPA